MRFRSNYQKSDATEWLPTSWNYSVEVLVEKLHPLFKDRWTLKTEKFQKLYTFFLNTSLSGFQLKDQCQKFLIEYSGTTTRLSIEIKMKELSFVYIKKVSCNNKGIQH